MNDEGVNSFRFGNMLLHFDGVDELTACLYVFCFFFFFWFPSFFLSFSFVGPGGIRGKFRGQNDNMLSLDIIGCITIRSTEPKSIRYEINKTL